MKRFLKEMIGIMGLTILISSQSPAFAAEKIQQNESTSVYSGINIGNETSSDGFVFNAGTGDITITSYTGNAEDVVVPAEINGRKVKAIAQRTFFYNDTMKTLTISEGIEEVSSGFAEKCENLKKIVLPASTKIVGSFYTGNNGFTTECDSVEEIFVSDENPYLVVCDGILYDHQMTNIIEYPAGKKVEYVKIPDGVTTICAHAFQNNSYLKKLELPDSIESIGYWAFYGCTSLEEVNIPKKCQFIGQFAFSYTAVKHIRIPAATEKILVASFEENQFETIEVEEGNPYYYAKDGVLYSGKDCLVSYACGSKNSEFVVPDEVTVIAMGAFTNAKNLKKVTISSTVEIISENAFAGCSQLEEVCINEGNLKEIRQSAFGSCPRLKTIHIPQTVTSIERYAFSECRELPEITLPQGLKEITEYMFIGCSSLEIVEIPASVTKISGNAFFDTSLRNIYYGGNEEQWDTIENENNDFSNCRIFFNGEKCEHVWADTLTVDKQPKCESEGVQSIHCIICGVKEKGTEQIIPANGHEFGEWNTIEESCEAPTREVRYCKNCGFAEEKNIGILGHVLTYYSGIRNGKEIEFWHCSKCSKNFSDEQTTNQIEIADGWIEMSDGMHYVQNGALLVNEWLTVDGHTYYLVNGIPLCDGGMSVWIDGKTLNYFFDQNGYMITEGWFVKENDKAYCGADGVAYVGLHEIDGNQYYFNAFGIACVNGCITVDGITYICASDGKLTQMESDTGWGEIKEEFGNSGWYYVQDGQILKSQWLTVDGYTYYLSDDGRMLENEERLLQDPSGDESHVYRFAPNGAMVTGWYQLENGEWQYRDGNGIVKTGWVYLNNIWYYLNEEGIMATGWKIVNGAWYFFNESGVMQIGWQQLGTIWYYLSESGAMVTGWLNLNGTWYYMTPSGSMAIGWCAVGNNWYYLSESGAMVTGWLNLSGTWYYMNINGAMLTGTHVIDGNNYIFDQNGAWVE